MLKLQNLEVSLKTVAPQSLLINIAVTIASNLRTHQSVPMRTHSKDARGGRDEDDVRRLDRSSRRYEDDEDDRDSSDEDEDRERPVLPGHRYRRGELTRACELV